MTRTLPIDGGIMAAVLTPLADDMSPDHTGAGWTTAEIYSLRGAPGSRFTGQRAKPIRSAWQSD